MARKRSSEWDSGWGNFPASVPRRTADGIRARSRRGDFGANWWSKRWLAVLNSFGLGTRLSRGRSYARQGQVLEIEIEPGLVRARVQGSQVRPYKVSIKLLPWSDEAKGQALAALSAESRHLAKLLNGELPPEAEEIFRGAGAPLFPARSADLVTDCSCPDWSNPCKHIAAVFYLIGEELDRDPLLLLKLRGLSREEILPAVESEASRPPEPLSAELAGFWNGGEIPPAEPAPSPPVTAAIPKRLGPFPFWPGESPFLETMERIYRAVAAAGGLPPEPTPGAVGEALTGTGVPRRGKSRDRDALEADLEAGRELAEIRAIYDGRLLRGYLPPEA